MNNKMYTVEISNVCAETVYANAPKQAVQYVIKTNQLPYKILSTHDITNSMQVGVKVSLLGGTKESVSYYVLGKVNDWFVD